MSEGIRYRPSPEERQFLADSALLLDIKQAAKSKGIPLRLQESSVAVTEKPDQDQLEFTLTYPLDSDANSRNGRIYLTDSFTVSKKDMQLVAYRRALKPEPRSRAFSKKTWKDRLGALRTLPALTTGHSAVQGFAKTVLPHLHRPFSENFRSFFKDVQGELFAPLLPLLKKHQMQMIPQDPESGWRISEEGKKLRLEMVVVLDHAKAPRSSAKNKRIYLVETYELSPFTHKLTGVSRKILLQSPPNRALRKVYDEFQQAPASDAQAKALQAFVQQALDELKVPKKIKPQAPPKAPQTPPLGEWSPRSQRILEKLWILSDQPSFQSLRTLSAPGKNLPNMAEKKLPAEVTQGFFKHEISRRAFHDSIDLLIQRDPQTSNRIQSWIEEQSLSLEIIPVLYALSALSQNRLEEAWRWIHRADASSMLQNQVKNLIHRQIDQKNAQWALSVLEAYVEEKSLKDASAERGWGASLWRSLRGKSSTNFSAAETNAKSVFGQLDRAVQKEEVNLQLILERIPLKNPAEQALRETWLQDPIVQELLSISQELDPLIQARELAYFAEHRLLLDKNMPFSAQSAAAFIPAGTPGLASLKRWLSGDVGFGKKLQMLPERLDESLSLSMVGGLVLGGALANLGKAAFFSRFGATTTALRLGGEIPALLIEAPAFLYSDKIARSLFDTPDHLWDAPGEELVGSYLTFGMFRGMGFAVKELRPYAGEWNAIKKLAQSPQRWKQWAVPVLEKSSPYVLGMVSLSAGNSLARAWGLRPESGQGTWSNIIDDILMYGHFGLSNNLAARGRLRLWEPYNQELESQARLQQKLMASRFNSAVVKTSETPAPTPSAHPFLRGFKEQEASTYFSNLASWIPNSYVTRGSGDAAFPARIRADLMRGVPKLDSTAPASIDVASMRDLTEHISHYLKFNQGTVIPLLPYSEPWVLGAKSPIVPNSRLISLEPRAKVNATLYFSADGQLVLKVNPGKEAIYVHRNTSQGDQVPLEKVTQWTSLSGGERVYLGRGGAFFEVERGSVNFPLKKMSPISSLDPDAKAAAPIGGQIDMKAQRTVAPTQPQASVIVSLDPAANPPPITTK